MRYKEFDAVIERRIELIRQSMQTKQKEYTREGSAFHNFDEAGKEFDCTPAEALIGMWAKHYISLKDILRDMSEMKNGIMILVDSDKVGVKIADAFIEEKIGDLINYLVILEGILKDKANG